MDSKKTLWRHQKSGQLTFGPLIAFNQPFETHFGSTFFITRWRCLHPRNLDWFSNWCFEHPLPLANEQAAIWLAISSASVWNPPYLPFYLEFDHFDLSRSWERGLLHLELYRVLIQWEKINIKQNPFSGRYFQIIPFYTFESVNRETHPLSCPYYMEGKFVIINDSYRQQLPRWRFRVTSQINGLRLSKRNELWNFWS